ncbi:hypothetical protein N9N28_15655 [Rubripirellula amarantea]|nr:hypothetical protein [Rubripirellula amarantea]
MKNLLLLVAAIVCGLVAFWANYKYLEKSTDEPMVTYVGVSKAISVGEELTYDSIGGIDLPSDVVIDAVRTEDAAAIVGRKSLRKYKQGELVLWQDVSGPRADLELGGDETGLPLDVSSFLLEPSLVRVGDMLSFVASTPGDSGDATNSDDIRMLGAFRVVAIGDLVFQGSGVSNAAEYQARISTITVAIQMKNGEPDQKAKDLIRASDSSAILRVLLSSRETK